MGISTVNASLSKGQIEVLRRIASGMSSRETAEDLYCSKRTVDFHLTSIYLKLNVSNRIQAIRRATALGLINLSDVPRGVPQPVSQQPLIQKQSVVRLSEACL